MLSVLNISWFLEMSNHFLTLTVLQVGGCDEGRTAKHVHFQCSVLFSVQMRLSCHSNTLPLVFVWYFFTPNEMIIITSSTVLHCGKWCQLTSTTGVSQSVRMALARFSYTAYNRSTCNKVWNASFKFNHISHLGHTFPCTWALLSCCFSQ